MAGRAGGDLACASGSSRCRDAGLALDCVGQADDGVDGAEAKGGVGFEVQDARGVFQGSREGEVHFGFAVVFVGGADGVVEGLDVWLGEPGEDVERVFLK